MNEKKELLNKIKEEKSQLNIDIEESKKNLKNKKDNLEKNKEEAKKIRLQIQELED